MPKVRPQSLKVPASDIFREHKIISNKFISRWIESESNLTISLNKRTKLEKNVWSSYRVSHDTGHPKFGYDTLRGIVYIPAPFTPIYKSPLLGQKMYFQ